MRSYFLFYLRVFFSSSWKKRPKEKRVFSFLLPLLGVAVGVSGFLFVISVMNGFVARLKERLLLFEPHLLVECSDLNFCLKKLEEDERVEKAFFFRRTEAFLKVEDRLRAVVVASLDDKDLVKMVWSSFYGHQLLLEGSNLRKGSAPFALGVFLKQDLKLKREEEAALIPLKGSEGSLNLNFFHYPVYLDDFFYTHHQEIDREWVLLSPAFFEEFSFGLKERFSQKIWVQLFEPFHVQSFWEDFQSRLPSSLFLESSTWEERNQNLLKALQLERWAVLFVLLMVLVVSCFSISLSLVLFLRRRIKEMAILLSLGLSRNQLKRLYLTIGFLIGVMGFFLGWGGAFLGLKLLSNEWFLFYLNQVLSFFHLEKVSALPVLFSQRDFCFCGLISLFLSLLASYWPTRILNGVSLTDVLSKRVV